jgi:hypothetical protein
MSRRMVSVALLAAPLASACGFLLDFNELQRGTPKSVDAGKGSGGHPADGTDAAPHCGMDCADADPCTIDACEKAGCTHTYTAGVVPDGLSVTVPGEKFHRVTMTSLGNRFYMSVLRSTGAKFDVELNHFSNVDTILTGPVSVSGVAGLPAMPVSAMGLAPGPLGLDIEGYVAVGPAPTLPAHVYKLLFGLQLKFASATAAAADANYLGGLRVYPVAWSEGVANALWGAWPGNGSGVYLHNGTTTTPAGALPTIATGAQVVALAPLGVGAVPGVLYVSDGPYAQALGQPTPVALGQCDTRAGAFSSATSAPVPGLPGAWSGAWSKTVGSSVLTEQLVVGCVNQRGVSACGGSTKCEAKDLIAGVRNPALTFAKVQGDPAGRVYEIFVLPAIDLAKNTASLQVQVVRADINLTSGDAGVQTLSLTPTPLELASAQVTRMDQGPDLPAVAFVGPDKFAVAWIQPSATGSGDELHVERERICFPAP